MTHPFDLRPADFDPETTEMASTEHCRCAFFAEFARDDGYRLLRVHSAPCGQHGSALAPSLEPYANDIMECGAYSPPMPSSRP